MAMETCENLEGPVVAIDEAKVDLGETAWKRSKREKSEPVAAFCSDHGVCDRCKRHGQRCDGEAPCGYCSVGGFSCERAVKKAARAKSAGHSGKARVSAEVPRCENCRKGHRKCDRGTPCHECVARGLRCVAGGAGDAVTTPVPPQLSAVAVGTPIESSEESELPCQECRNLHRRCDRQLPCTSCVMRSALCSYPSPI
jgi:hypothetical protein